MISVNKLKSYYSNLNIRGKISVTIIGAASVILVFIMSIMLWHARSDAKENAMLFAKSVCAENAAKASCQIDEQIYSLHSAVHSYESHSATGALRFDAYKRLIDHTVKEDTIVFAAWIVEGSKGNDTSLVHRYAAVNGTSVSQEEVLLQAERNAGYAKARQNGEVVVSDPINIGGEWVIGITMPLEVNDTFVGATGYFVKSELFNHIVDESMRTQGIVSKIITSNGFIGAHYDRGKVGQKLDEGAETDEIMSSIKNGKEYQDFSYSSTLDEDAFKVYIPMVFYGTKSQWSFCTNFSKSSIAHKTNMVALLILALMFVGLVLLAIATTAISKVISAPIVAASNELKLISEGRLSEVKRISIDSKDEIGVMVDGLNDLTENLQHLASFAHKIGTGDLDADISAKSEKDILGKSLVEMKQNLIAAREMENERKRADEIQRWKVEGNARIHETIRKENTSIKQLCDAILHEIVGFSSYVQGGIFIINDDQENETYVELVSCIAYNRKKLMAKRVELDEGMIGRCIYEKAPIVLTEIPQDYLSITSGLGDRRPEFLVIVPLINNEQVIGAIELASFGTKEPYVMEYLEKTAESLASAIANVKINERTQKLLDQSKLFAEEMAAQEEELRQNMEEMQAAQEEMHRKTQEYEETIRSLNAELGMN